ncbi:hypothetical protein Q4F19_03395 [Sphingomonas sp. BIUV-7]|uniref:ResB-like domain-containing protein n=1 Tax=Sphingomonas natans TaxID=3063330 RepID=A0ABT8Y528_9SPHN|nr:hypothetical protein [Sphingomonas sp. BIUV-7]MDO6413418.1 hypothetical protein [Sphingomonas sp. BIUV-7]
MTSIAHISPAARSDEPFWKRHRVSPRLAIMWLWVLVVVLYFAWEAATYRGIFAILAEWQFDRLGQDLPTFNFCLLTMALAWPALAILRRRTLSRDELAASRAHTLSDDDLDDDEWEQEAQLALFSAQDYMHFLLGFGASLGIAALIALLWTLTLPTGTEPPRSFTPGVVGGSEPQEGSARIEGAVRYGRIASFNRGILFFNRTALFAPIVPPKGSDGRVRYFVEFLPVERPDLSAGATISHRTGILVHADLPGALVRLYRYLGYQPIEHYYVLYASAATIRWPYYIIAAQFLLGGLLFGATGLGQWRHVRKLRGDLDYYHSDDWNGADETPSARR